ncbi:hypothetical protein BD413DRAFT_167630 [Trametes elegans]|nr:hypothetical protein BD413DRAFT_167630 [Trametes elegans]
MPGPTSDNTVGATDPWTAVLPPAIDNSFGAILVGSFVGYMLYGLALHQGYRYFRIVGYERDSVYVKGTVAAVLILETLHTALAMDLCYSYLVTNYFKPQALLHSTWTADIMPAVTGLIVAITQGFFAGRVFLLNRKYLAILAFVVCLLVGELGFAIACSVEAFIQPDLFHTENLKWLSTATLALIISAKGMLIPLLTWILFKTRMSMKPRRTDSMLSTLMLYSVNNAAPSRTSRGVS